MSGADLNPFVRRPKRWQVEDFDAAVISDSTRYRYTLSRRWADGPVAAFVMLNPSTADACTDDATVRKCKGFAKRWGCDALLVLNLFAFRATRPRDLIAAAAAGDDVVGPSNLVYLSHLRDLDDLGPVVAAWGNNALHPALVDAGQRSMARLSEAVPRVEHLGLTKRKQPRHPLYVSYDTELQPLELPSRRAE